jgi:hypothetical protein
MTPQGLRGDQVTLARGFADEQLRKSEAPLDWSGRRIFLIVKYEEKAVEAPVAASPECEKPEETEKQK